MDLNLPNLITILRILLIPVFVTLYYLQTNELNNEVDYWVNFSLTACFALASVTDYLDGYLARKLHMSSKFGEFLDPVADKLIVVTALILLTDFYSLWFVTISSIIIIMREVTVSALREWLGRVGVGQSRLMAVSYLGKVKTVMQISAILFLLYQSPFFGFNSFYIGIILLFCATILTVISGIQYLQIFMKELSHQIHA